MKDRAGVEPEALPDHELLGRFTTSRDPVAFRVIVVRYGSLVMRVCRGVLRNTHDAEDAFQGTFLSLLENARAIRSRTSLAAWLQRTAYRVSLRAVERRQRVSLHAELHMIPDERLDEVAQRDAEWVLHEELSQMPDKYRAPLVLCYLERRTHKQAARELGCTLGGLRGRLERARQQLRLRLMRRGLGVFCLAGGSVMVSDTLLRSTVDMAVAFAGGGTIPAEILSLARGGRQVISTSAKCAVASVIVAALLAVCGMLVTKRTEAEERVVVAPAVRRSPEVIETFPFSLALAEESEDDEVTTRREMTSDQPGRLVPVGAFGVDRDRVVDILREREQLIRTMQCVIEVKVIPTTSEEVAMIRRVVEEQKDEEEKKRGYTRFVTTPERAQLHSKTIHWWKDGERERYNEFLFGTSATPSEDPLRIQAFDGQLFRTLTPRPQDDGRIRGAVRTRQQRWDNMNRLNPFTFLYAFQTDYYSDLLADATVYDISPVRDESGTFTRVTFQHPSFTYQSFELLFDTDWKLQHRKLITERREPRPRVHEIHNFHAYDAVADAGGMIISFPLRATYVYYMGELDGELVPWRTNEVTIKNLRINEDIDGGLFTLEFPDDALVYDAVRDAGYVPAASLSGNATPDPQEDEEVSHLSAGRLALTVVVGSLCLLVLFFFRFRRSP